MTLQTSEVRKAELAVLVEQIAGILGEHWTVSLGPYRYARVDLYGPQEIWIGFTEQSRGSKMVLEIGWGCPPSLCDTAQMIEHTHPQISVSRSRPAVEIVKEMQRRLLPDIIKVLLSLRSAKVVAERRDEATWANLARLAGLMGEPVKVFMRDGKEAYGYWYRWGPVHALSVEVRTYETDADLLCRSLPINVAAAVCEVITRMVPKDAKPGAGDTDEEAASE